MSACIEPFNNLFPPSFPSPLRPEGRKIPPPGALEVLPADGLRGGKFAVAEPFSLNTTPSKDSYFKAKAYFDAKATP